MRWPLLTALALFAFSACSFDDSTLPSKVGCERNDDCVSGVCSGGRCIVFDASSGGSGDVGTTDASGPDAGDQVCGGATLDACGGCGNPDAVIGEPCDDLCGTWACEGTQLTCVGNPVNACGGCDTLDGDPGAECGGCGQWVCGDEGTVVCEGIAANPCGGCEPIAGQPDDPCGTCGIGRLECDGFDALICAGDAVDFCGGCEAPADANLADPCLCDGAAWDDPAAWSCDGASATCGDTSDVDFGGPAFGPYDDSASGFIELTGAIESAGDYDWHRIRIRDTADVDGLFPQVELEEADIADLVCLFWTYDEPRTWPIGCSGGADLWEHEGQLGCCSQQRNPTKVAGLIRDDIGVRLDSTPGANNDDGTLHVLVINEDNRASCRPWRARVSF